MENIKQYFGIYIGETARQLLLQGIVFRVHSVFRDVVNLIGEAEELVTVAKLQKGRAWYFLNVVPEEDFLLNVTKDDVFYRESDSLLSDKVKINFKEAVIWRGVREEVSKEVNLDDLKNIKNAVLLLKPWIAKFLSEKKLEKIKKLPSLSLEEAFSEFLGWGEGLTPWGDDFLTGWSLVLALLEPQKARKLYFACAPEIREKTNLISCQQLLSALSGQGHEFVEKFLLNLLKRGIFDQWSFERILKFGATSGEGLITGMYFGLKQEERELMG